MLPKGPRLVVVAFLALIVCYRVAEGFVVGGEQRNQQQPWPGARSWEQVSARSLILVSRLADGTQGNDNSAFPAISANGSAIAFESAASNLVSGDTNHCFMPPGPSQSCADIFVRDQSGNMTRVSVGSDGTEGNGPSTTPSISADGSLVAFRSEASTLVSDDTNQAADIFVHNRVTGTTIRISVASDRSQANAGSFAPALSADGQFVAFSSSASNLVNGDSNNGEDVFVHELNSSQTMRLSVASDGTQGNGPSYGRSISADGRFVAFSSLASNLVSGDTNETDDVFVHDRATGQTILVSRTPDGSTGNGSSTTPWLAADGRLVVFQSSASNLVAGDDNSARDIFVHDLNTQQTTRVSVASNRTEANGSSSVATLSGDGRFVAFGSTVTNLVSGDINGLEDVFLHDRTTGTTMRVSESLAGVQGDGASSYPALSLDGRFVAFASGASTLVSGDSNARGDVFLYDQGSLTELQPVLWLPLIQGRVSQP
jgi:Tol biopolymer transport system component